VIKQACSCVSVCLHFTPFSLTTFIKNYVITLCDCKCFHSLVNPVQHCIDYHCSLELVVEQINLT